MPCAICVLTGTTDRYQRPTTPPRAFSTRILQSAFCLQRLRSGSWQCQTPRVCRSALARSMLSGVTQSAVPVKVSTVTAAWRTLWRPALRLTSERFRSSPWTRLAAILASPGARLPALYLRTAGGLFCVRGATSIHRKQSKQTTQRWPETPTESLDESANVFLQYPLRQYRPHGNLSSYVRVALAKLLLSSTTLHGQG